jgi:uncharacterized membrane protein
MNQRALIAAAAATLLSSVMISTGVNAASHAAAPAASKEKCYGIAKAGQNDCANLARTLAQASLKLMPTKASGSMWPLALAPP